MKITFNTRNKRYDGSKHFMDIKSLLGGIIVIVLGALMLAEGVLVQVAGLSLFFTGTNPLFAMSVGIIALLIGSFLVEKGEEE